MTQLEKDTWSIFTSIVFAILTTVFGVAFVFELLFAVQLDLVLMWTKEALAIGIVMCTLCLMVSILAQKKRDMTEGDFFWILVLRRLSFVFFVISLAGIFFEEIRPIAVWVNVIASASVAYTFADISFFDKKQLI